MNFTIRFMKNEDKQFVLSMMKEFYSSELVFTNGSEEIFENDFGNCIENPQYLNGFVFCENEKIIGYAMIAKSFSTEFGKPCIWLEDLYLQKNYRKKGISALLFEYLKKEYPNHIFRLEVETENKHAMHVYEKQGFTILPYTEMIKNY